MLPSLVLLRRVVWLLQQVLCHSNVFAFCVCNIMDSSLECESHAVAICSCVFRCTSTTCTCMYCVMAAVIGCRECAPDCGISHGGVCLVRVPLAQSWCCDLCHNLAELQSHSHQLTLVSNPGRVARCGVWGLVADWPNLGMCG
jgi:hypothetical protein